MSYVIIKVGSYLARLNAPPHEYTAIYLKQGLRSHQQRLLVEDVLPTLKMFISIPTPYARVLLPCCCRCDQALTDSK